VRREVVDGCWGCIGEWSSGKRHKAGVNVQVLSDLSGQLLAASEPVPGRTRPRRKRPGHTTRTPPTKVWNQSIAHHRAAVERAIAPWMNWKILATGYRGRLTELPNIIRIITTLEYYRLGW
jgi:hypothetical protein